MDDQQAAAAAYTLQLKIRDFDGSKEIKDTIIFTVIFILVIKKITTKKNMNS
jgi:hypothetical protein